MPANFYFRQKNISRRLVFMLM